MFDKGQAMLLWALECSEELKAEWNEWYNLEHLPALVQVPGFISGNRYEKIQSFDLEGITPRGEVPLYLTFYELYDDHVLSSEAYNINRNSLGPGMRPEWTKRMLTYITKIMGGRYYPMSDTTINNLNRNVDDLIVLYIDPKEDNLEDFNDWYKTEFTAKVSDLSYVDACKLMGTHDTTAPKVLGGVQQIPGPKRILFFSVPKGVGEDHLERFAKIISESSSYVESGVGVLYKRMSLAK